MHCHLDDVTTNVPDPSPARSLFSGEESPQMNPKPVLSMPGLSRRAALGRGAALGAALGLGRLSRAGA